MVLNATVNFHRMQSTVEHENNVDPVTRQLSETTSSDSLVSKSATAVFYQHLYEPQFGIYYHNGTYENSFSHL